MNNIQPQNGTSVIVSNGKVSINGKLIDTPKGMNVYNSTVINNKVYIGGYEFDANTNEFKRTLKALFYYWF